MQFIEYFPRQQCSKSKSWLWLQLLLLWSDRRKLQTKKRTERKKNMLSRLRGVKHKFNIWTKCQRELQWQWQPATRTTANTLVNLIYAKFTEKKVLAVPTDSQPATINQLADVDANEKVVDELDYCAFWMFYQTDALLPLKLANAFDWWDLFRSQWNVI